jgi:glyoxylase-like metal-dependent hydrolase (beta-lactamase superfamily II)
MAKSLPAEQVPGIYRRDLGEFRIATVHDGMLGASFEDVVGVKPETWEAAHRADFRKIPPRLSCNTFAIERAGRLVLVDAGCGATTPGAGRQIEGLSALGVAPADVDAVLMTHLHRDHAAGLIDSAGAAVFRNAEIIVHRDDLDFWGNEMTLGRLRESQRQDFAIATAVLHAYADRIRSVASGEVIPNVTALPTPGHTPGHTAWLLDGDSERLLIWGDIVHLPVIQFARPEAGVVYDIDSPAAAMTRRRVLDMAATERWLVAGVHLDFPCFGRVEARGVHGFAYTNEVWSSAL